MESPRPERARRAPGKPLGRREGSRRRVGVEALESRQLMAAQAFAQYPLAPDTTPSKIALAPDGSLWFAEDGATPATLGRVTASGDLAQSQVTLSPGDTTFGVTLGPDNNIWATEQGASPAIAQVVPSASSPTFTEFTNFPTLPGNPTHAVASITRGPSTDSTYVWFVDTGANAIGRVAVNGAPNQPIQEFPLASGRIVGTEIAAGPAGDDGVYFLETSSFGAQSFIGRIDPNGNVTEFPVANNAGLAPGTPTGLTAGPDDSIYFTEQNTNRIGQLNLATGVVNDDFYSIPAVTLPGNSSPTPAGPESIAEFSDGSLYVTESNIGAVAKLSVSPTGAATGFFQYTPFPTVSGSLPGLAAGADGSAWFTESGTSRVDHLSFATDALQAQPATIDGTADKLLANIPIATFTDPDGPSPSTQYTATINWGDGTATDSDVTFNPTGTASTFQLLASHTYAVAGKYTPVVTISDTASNRSATVFDTANIAVPNIGPVGPAGSISAAAGTPFLGVDSTGAAEPVATFSVPIGTAGSYQATVDWGDGTALGGATITSSTAGGVTTDSVIATHTFAQGGTFHGSVTLTNPDGSLTVFPLTSNVSGLGVATDSGLPGPEGAAGTPIASSTLPIAIGAGTAPIIDLNPVDYSVTLNWGDGTPSTLGRVISQGVGLGIVTGPHTYAAPGNYTLTYTLGDAGAPSLLTGTITVTAAGLTGTPVAQSGVVGTPIGGGSPVPLETVASLPIPAAPLGGGGTPALQGGYYSATIDYGDGSATSVGTIVTNADGTLTVDGPSHTYQAPGNYQVTILIGDAGQPNLARFTSTVAVAEAPIAVNGTLNPASDSGISNTDAITNVVTPNFDGVTAPGASVKLYATLTADPALGPILIGQGFADASGAYSINTIPLADGSYDISAVAVSKFGGASAFALIESGDHPLVIDTVGPKITGFAVSNTLKGQFQVTYQDGRSGLVPSQLVNGSNYDVQRPVPAPRPAQDFIVSTLSATPETSPTGPITVTGSVFNGHYVVLRGGEFVFTINSSGITDVAGNALDGEFYGTFPTGDGHPGGDFKAKVIIKGYTPSGPIPFSTANPANPGTAAVSPTALAPKLKKPGLNAPPTSLPGVNTGEPLVSTTSTHAKVATKAKAVVVKSVKAKTVVVNQKA